MILRTKFDDIKGLQRLNKYACSSNDEIWVHSLDGQIRVDAKSVIGLFCIDYSTPVEIVTGSDIAFKTLSMMFKVDKQC